MRVVVTGGSGFLGSHVADALSEAGHAVTIFDVRPSPWRRDDQREVVADILDLEALSAALSEADAVYHLAGMAGIADAARHPRRATELNVIGTLNALEASVEQGIQRFVHASTIYTLSNSGGFYRVTKTAAEGLVREFHEHHGLAATVLRFGSLYGPRADGENAIERLLQQAVNEGRIDYWGTGDEVREYIHVHDAAELAVAVLDDRYAGDVVHLTGRERIRTEELLEMIREMLASEVDIALGARSVEGHYKVTPYAFRPDLGRRLTKPEYIDLGLGLLGCLHDVASRSEGLRHPGPDPGREPPVADPDVR